MLACVEKEERTIFRWLRQLPCARTMERSTSKELMAGIESRFFEGPEHQRSPRYSLTDFDNGLYKTVGEISAVSLAQGGPAPAFFSPWTYSYLCSGQIIPTILNRDSVADVQLQGLLDQIYWSYLCAKQGVHSSVPSYSSTEVAAYVGSIKRRPAVVWPSTANRAVPRYLPGPVCSFWNIELYDFDNRQVWTSLENGK
ncbi:hypothetical protein UPYG_G00319670 [Umbra pygmaea]|uniref:Uncharacterized protein n=1 Tax=Umbra pygmaea TaxID=75934 RepID=A0ABD0W0B6_UMBPY